MTREPLLLVEGLCKCFGELRAVDQVSLSVNRGETVGIVGPNGAGKTTLLDAIAGDVTPDDGRVSRAGATTRGLPADEIAGKGLVRTYQQPRFVGELSVFDNLKLAVRGQTGESWWCSLFGRAWAAEEQAIEGRCHSLLEELDLSPMANVKAMELSYGQVKLMTLGMALLAGASCVALDEPVAGMAPHLREVAAAIMTDRLEDSAVLIIEHDIDFLRRVTDRIIFMAQGRVLMDGAPDHVLSSQTALEAYLGVDEYDEHTST